ncbi:SgcJ/EcaC family oxidoreductase [Streptosporangium sp. NPDC049046]|uniref:YybH family protein n=1 Tax=unclassified Streptosporangium TaxID=2632669 RepID=UPI00342DF2F4
MMRQLAERPEDVPTVFAERFNAGDAEAVAEIYESDAVFVSESGAPLTGEQINAANGRFMDLGLPITVRPRHVHTTGDLALLIVDWVIDGTDRGGRPVHLQGTATDVARRGQDGYWRYAIDNPFGAAEKG